MSDKSLEIHVDGRRFRDGWGREAILRGFNLGGDSKVPFPAGGTYLRDSLQAPRDVSFVGRPFPIDEAAEHLNRLRTAGAGVLRLVTTWEAVEHAGPGKFDVAYLDYFARICAAAGDFGMSVIVDFHQDVFSRFTGGDGAPAWAVELCGLDLSAIAAADAAVVMQAHYDYESPRAVQHDRYPPMVWTRNYHYPANGLLWTLFFGGATFAPDFRVDGRNIQDVLQAHYLGAVAAVAEAVRDQRHVIGFGTLNEPGRGWIGCPLTRRRDHDRPGEPALPGPALSPLDCLCLLAGRAVDVPDLEFIPWRLRFAPSGMRRLNPRNIRVWRQGAVDPFAGRAWQMEASGPKVLDEQWFVRRGARKFEFTRDFLAPFYTRVATTVRAHRNRWLIFVEKDAAETFFDPEVRAPVPEHSVNAGHWYDILALGLKRLNTRLHVDVFSRRPVFGRGGIRSMYLRQLRRLAAAQVGGRAVPFLLGEFGIPFDLRSGQSYKRWAAGERGRRVWREQEIALSLMYDALDALGASSTQWNYTASNRNDPRVGDGWNQEDFSIFSRDQMDAAAGRYSGFRAAHGFIRPYARRIQGDFVRARFSTASAQFDLDIVARAEITAPTEIFVPWIWYTGAPKIETWPDAECRFDAGCELVTVMARESGPLSIRLRKGA